MSADLRRLVAIAAMAATAVMPVVAAPYAASEAADDGGDRVAPVLGTASPDRIAGHYVVVLRDTTSRPTERAAHRAVARLGGEVLATYRSALTGFSARLPRPAVAELSRNPAVAYIEADRRVRVAGAAADPPWGLDRIDQRRRPTDGAYHSELTGAGVTAYVVDTGIKADHASLGGRVGSGFTAVRDGNGTEDCRRGTGHGTHVAGTLGSDRYGVAPAVTIVPVRVLDCHGAGRWSWIIKGVDWVIRHHGSDAGPAVVNMSLTGARRGARAVVDAVNAAIDAGVTVVVAAGNSFDDACGYVPARIRRTISVGATNRFDQQARFSNHGECIDLYAPGVGVVSAGIRSRWATETMSGTSMASPHVAGVAALVLESDPTASPWQVGAAITRNATPGVVRRPGPGSPDLLLYSGFLAPAPAG